MSAYIVEDKTINRIVTFLAGAHNWTAGPRCYLSRVGEPFGFHAGDREERKRASALAREMLQMNMAAVHARYERADDMMPDTPFEFAWHHGPVNLTQVLKSLNCFLYQCSEGEIPDKWPLFSRLDKTRDELAMHLATETPEYEKAEWA